MAELPDDLTELIAENMDKPEFVAGWQDAHQRNELRQILAAVRMNSGLTQAQLAEKMHITQSTLSQIESEANDPRLSTLQRYAWALGCQLRITVEPRDG